MGHKNPTHKRGKSDIFNYIEGKVVVKQKQQNRWRQGINWEKYLQNIWQKLILLICTESIQINKKQPTA